MIDHHLVLLACRAKLETLSVTLPDVSSENIRFEPTVGTAWFEESYSPGPMVGVTLGSGGELEILPTYTVNVWVPEDTAVKTAWEYGTAILLLFAPGTALTVAGHTATVRRDVAPWAGKILEGDGWAVLPVQIPLRVRTTNSN